MDLFKRNKYLPNVFLAENGLFGYKNEQDEIILDPIYKMAYPFDSKSKVALVMLDANEKYIFIDIDGNKTHDQEYKWAIIEKGKTIVGNNSYSHVINPMTGETDAFATLDYNAK